MFDSGYAYSLKTKNVYKGSEDRLISIIYTFKTRYKKTYIVQVDKFRLNVFVIKFYLKSHRLSDNKYNLVVGELESNRFDAIRVLKTVIDIALSILKEEITASFAFVGAYKLRNKTNKVNKNTFEDRDTVETQRYRIYWRLAELFMGETTFYHSYIEETNAYLYLNGTNINSEDEVSVLLDEITSMFTHTYEGLGPFEG